MYTFNTQDVETRWSYTYLLLKRLLDTRDAVFKTQEILAEQNQLPDGLKLTNQDWTNMECYCQILESFHYFTTIIQSRINITISLGTPLLAAIYKSLDNNLIYANQPLALKLKQEIKNRFFSSQLTNDETLAILCDPRMKNFWWADTRGNNLISVNLMKDIFKESIFKLYKASKDYYANIHQDLEVEEEVNEVEENVANNTVYIYLYLYNYIILDNSQFFS